ncbi:N-acetylmuramoyl-L-alanine amidase [Amylibacter marinus]|uniref:N-acetylmuramoyl-L-alanine amidase n=1 Tax=Amylibacter marinus TaxID=1475483 RepID=A0ABQ5VTW7_9RHOB|nr:N-acetylmuramoyl-L-alanine amidase [Amylibacter marinus]GLQ34883.1 N-acetylmuramoyl-L-alanine amidase [Amylibacter marinus]
MSWINTTKKSPNFGPRKHDRGPDLLVLHYTAMKSCDAAIDRLCDPNAEVSAHYVISETGAVHQLVDEEMRAWHAGAGRWGDVMDVNSHSIGIELANATTEALALPFPNAQIQALERLMRQIMARHPAITEDRVIGHSDMAPTRKFDPGAKFDWRRLALGGLSIWPKDVLQIGACSADQFLRDARTFGYTCEGATFDAVLAAFRMRFLPMLRGPLCAQDCAVMAALARDYPAKAIDARPITA